jgi:hypothetical protein
MSDAAKRMFELFRGHTGGHGTYGQEEKSPGKMKSEIKKTARTLREPPSVELWEKHLEGSRPLGIIPVNSEGRCYWGVIDVDKYDDLNHAAIVQALDRLKLPMHVCRSKSGGAHVFIFMKEPVRADELIAKLKEISVFLGFGGCEIFPKQTEILEDRGDLGNWLNMPYFNAERGSRYAVTEDGRGITLNRFLEKAFKTRLTEEQFHAVSPGSLSQDPELREAPPCLQYLGKVGLGDGSKNNGLFAFGVLAKKMYPDDWQNKLGEWNQKFVLPPRASQEDINGIIRSLKKKDYAYTCGSQPLSSHCDKRACKNRRFGVGGGSAPEISSISILDTTPPLFFVCLGDGGTIECCSDDILTSRAFQRATLEQRRVLLPLHKQDAWQEHIQRCLEEAILIEAPKEVGAAGTMMELLEQFCTDKHRAMEKDEILLGKPWLDDEHGRYYFRLSDLMRHFERNKFNEYRKSQVVQRIRDMGGQHSFFNMKGKGVNVWWVPEEQFSVQTEPHSVPRSPDSPI